METVTVTGGPSGSAPALWSKRICYCTAIETVTVTVIVTGGPSGSAPARGGRQLSTAALPAPHCERGV
eukprot:5687897-Pyramimonas_sp.AAC.1